MSAASVAVAIIALRRSGAAQKRSATAQTQAAEAQQQAADAQRRLAEIEEQREHERRIDSMSAMLIPELRKTGEHTYRLYLANHGDVAARRVRVELDGKPLAEHPTAVRNSPMPELVGPHAEVGCILGIHMGCVPPFAIRVFWDDDSGADRMHETTLTF